jgi:hypothetical protein
MLAVVAGGYSDLSAVMAVVKSVVVALSCIATVVVAKESLPTPTIFKCENHVSLQAAPEGKRLFSTFTAIFYFSKFVRFLLLSFGFNKFLRILYNIFLC